MAPRLLLAALLAPGTQSWGFQEVSCQEVSMEACSCHSPEAGLALGV